MPCYDFPGFRLQPWTFIVTFSGRFADLAWYLVLSPREGRSLTSWWRVIINPFRYPKCMELLLFVRSFLQLQVVTAAFLYFSQFLHLTNFRAGELYSVLQDQSLLDAWNTFLSRLLFRYCMFLQSDHDSLQLLIAKNFFFFNQIHSIS